jgi:hypothetical protein
MRIPAIDHQPDGLSAFILAYRRQKILLGSIHQPTVTESAPQTQLPRGRRRDARLIPSHRLRAAHTLANPAHNPTVHFVLDFPHDLR